MALLKCHECGATVSTEAKACQSCGAPPRKPMSPIVKYGGGFLVVTVGLGVVASFFIPNDAPKAAAPQPQPTAPVAAVAEAPAKPSCASDDLQCRGNDGSIAAGVYCRKAVESLAKHSMRWTDGFLEPKFDRFRWKGEVGGAITYVGNKAEFQNGFGAYTPIIYECDLGPDNKTVLGVRAREGRLSR